MMKVPMKALIDKNPNFDLTRSFTLRILIVFAETY